MTPAFFITFAAAHPFFAALGLVLWELTEIWLGVLKPMDAGSIPQLLWKLILRWKIKGEAHMPANPNARSLNVNVDGPTYDALGLIVDAVKKLAAGEKPQQVATEEIGQALAVFNEVPMIQADIALDRASVEAAVALRLADLIDALLAARAAKGASPK